MSRFFLPIMVLFLCFSCGITPKSAANLDLLEAYLVGSFDSKLQASTNDDYFEVSLKIQTIWQNRTDNWLYIEQALYDEQDAPYRQRVYKIEQRSATRFVSRIFEIKNPETFIGVIDNPMMIGRLRPDDLIERTGCAVHLRLEKDGSFRGSTRKQDCKSNYRGAAYVTSQTVIDARSFQSWDQGFNSAGEQVWGPTEGGYTFIKSEN